MKSLMLRFALFLLSLAALILIYLFQEWSYGAWIGGILGWPRNETAQWVVSKLVRFVLNDSFAILMIYTLFQERKYVLFAFLVQLFGFVFLLIPYLVLSLSFTFQHEASLSYLHRITMNPTLIMLLIPAFLYQKRTIVDS
ncbi:exosortase F system-associated protein [Cytophagales bacterium LB-30]|uniref:Exosortase F system-associated protein n=1 Tax=Shiella aurantiaca TaxID=3058365 RepID=A0ABT8F837_9BACT|nr:exosortase F system-associated protein [Shiella aurantiaca]MDN4166642.1 exosortase F system-associated protein [Shiella aurantiaca]